MNLEIKEIINNLKLANKNNLDKIYLQIEDDEKTEIINLESGEKTKHSEISKSDLLIRFRFKGSDFIQFIRPSHISPSRIIGLGWM